ncbi:MAG: hypothetical protein E7290_12545 [Lachnospiraceae bacterium]|nr:hypothetical protein [Lachnospiraceae bacterium]
MASGYDGTVKIDTRLDTQHFEQDAKTINQTARSQAARLAAEYKRQGMNASDAFKKAWSEVEHSSKSAAKKSQSYWKNSTKYTAKDIDSIKNAFGNLKSMLGSALLSLGGAYGLFQIGNQAIDLASDIQEVQNVVDTAFKSMSYKMEEFAKTSIEKFGLSKLAAKQMGSTFMAMASNMVPSMEQASDMAIELTGRAADMASFYNKTASETATALNSIFTGETETLKQYGVVMTEANLQQFAYRKGIQKTIADMTQAEKVQLRYNYVMEQTALAAGDFEKTSDSWANQTRILSEQFNELLSILGSGLITVLTPAIQGLNQVLSYLIDVANTLGTIFSKLLGINSVQISSSGGAAAEAYQDAADSVNGYTSAVKKANKANVASFDELTMLNAKSDSGSGAGAAVGTTDISAFNEELTVTEAVASDFEKKIEDIIANVKRLADALMQGFTESGMLGAFEELGFSIFDFFMELVEGFATIGSAIVENLIGGLAYAFQADGETLKEDLLSIFDIAGDIYIIAGTWFAALADVFSVVGGENGQALTGGLIGLFATTFTQLIGLALQVGRDIMSALARPLIENKEELKVAFDGILGVLSGCVGQIRGVINYAFAAFSEVYDKHIAPLIESIGAGLSYLVGVFLEFWNTHMQPMFEELGSYASLLIDEHVKPMIDSIMEFIGKVADALSLLWNSVLVPFIAWIAKNILPLVAPIIKAIGKMMMDFWATVSDVIGGVAEVLSSLIDFVVGVFTGDWQLAWDGITGVVKGAINIVIDCINGMIRALFSGINGAVDLINGLLGFIPEDLRVAVGIGELSHFNPPQIPRLATGTVVPPGMSQFLAILGDNNKETEVVSPLSTMKEALMEAMVEMGGIGQSGDIVINIDGKEVFRVVRDQDREYKKTTGKSAFA